jgi:hypothetical protein
MDSIFDHDQNKKVPTESLEENPDKMDFTCENCGYDWIQTYIPGVTDV